jgi:hypothetical protein
MKSIPLILLALFLTSCVAYDQDGYEERYVVSSYQEAMKPFDEVTLTRTSPINATYDFANVAISGATVRVMELAADGSVTTVFDFPMASPGIYRAADAAALVRPLTRYRLEIDIPGNDRLITATTLVPDTFRVKALNSRTLPYQGSEQFEANLTQSEYPGRQTYYVITTTALDTAQGMTPFYAEFNDEDRDVTTVSSGIINQLNYIALPDGSINLKYPWLAVAYFGPNRITFYAIDDNVYDFVRSASVQLGGSTTSPGEIENVLSTIDGAIGVFGSMSSAETVITVSVR